MKTAQSKSLPSHTHPQFQHALKQLLQRITNIQEDHSSSLHHIKEETFQQNKLQRQIITNLVKQHNNLLEVKFLEMNSIKQEFNLAIEETKSMKKEFQAMLSKNFEGKQNNINESGNKTKSGNFQEEWIEKIRRQIEEERKQQQIEIKNIKQAIQLNKKQIISCLQEQIHSQRQARMDSLREAINESISDVQIPEFENEVKAELLRLNKKLNELSQKSETFMSSKKIQQFLLNEAEQSKKKKVQCLIDSHGCFGNFSLDGNKITLTDKRRNEKGFIEYSQIWLNPVVKKEGFTFSTKIIQTKDSSIKIGIMDRRVQSRKKKFNHEFVISYLGRDGTVTYYQEGHYKHQKLGMGFQEDQILITEVNVKQGAISWYIKSNQQTKDKSSMKWPLLQEQGRHFVPYWQLWNQGDKIQWFLT